MATMQQFAGMTVDRLQEILSRFKTLRIAVVGDFFLDKYLDVDPRLAETSLETGKIAHQVVRVRHSPGAAGTVVCNLVALGVGTIHCVGLIGDDGEGYELRQDLVSLGCGVEHLHLCSNRLTPTYVKPRDVTDPSLAGEHSRYDFKNRTKTPDNLRHKIIESLGTLLPQIDALIVLDQVEEEDCGVVTGDLKEFLAEEAPRRPDVTFWADSRRRIREFRHLHLKCNQYELIRKDCHHEEAQPAWDVLFQAIPELRKVNEAPIVVTLGEKGMLVSDPVVTWIPGVRVSGPTDPTGAGDSATAGAVAALASGATLPEAALVGNLVASITVQQLATTGTARPEELPPRLQMWIEQQRRD
ncbi:MAG: bifunctional heptose 7-phosphate kinase/heptose 1-phosphate adenyltransferase [Thermogutta sp.]